jgi:hypothetical protein
VAPGYGEVLTLESLRQEVKREGHRGVPEATSIFLRAVDWRMNSNSVLASVPTFSGGDPGVAFVTWLDSGAPGLSEAANNCDWEGRFDDLSPGPAPSLVPLSGAKFVDTLRAMLTTSISYYHIRIAEPETILSAFLDAEFDQANLAPYRFFRVPVSELECRTHYFDGFESDDCLIWCRDTMRVLFVNGSD